VAALGVARTLLVGRSLDEDVAAALSNHTLLLLFRLIVLNLSTLLDWSKRVIVIIIIIIIIFTRVASAVPREPSCHCHAGTQLPGL
jgi:hypothetical protein